MQGGSLHVGDGCFPISPRGETRLEKQKDEDWLLRFGTHRPRDQTAAFRDQVRTYSGRLSRSLIWESPTLGGPRRHESVGGAPVRKVPVTPAMLSWIKAYRPRRVEPSRFGEVCFVGFGLLRLVLHASSLGVPPWERSAERSDQGFERKRLGFLQEWAPMLSHGG